MISHLDLHQLRMFFTLAQTGSYTITAKRLFRTQSAVSHAIRKLEESAGVKLVEKSGPQFQLSEAGSKLYNACKTIFYTLETAVEEIAMHRGASMGLLRIGATVEFGCSILMKHMQPFVKAHQNIAVEFHMSNNLLPKLQRDLLDVIIDCKEHVQPDLDRIPLFREVYAIIAAPGYTQELGIKTIPDLQRATILSIDRECTWWHRLLFSLSPTDRPELLHIIPINHIRGMIVAARQGIGVALVPKYSVLAELAEGQLELVFPDLNLNEDRFCIYQKSAKKHLERHRLLVEYLQAIRPVEFGSILPSPGASDNTR